MKHSLIVFLMLAACGGGDDAGGDGVDAAPSNLRAEEVACPAQADATVNTNGFSYAPASTVVTVGQVVAFTMPSEHDAASDDGMFSAGFNATTCVRFDAPGTYRFHCTPHRFDGSVRVE